MTSKTRLQVLQQFLNDIRIFRVWGSEILTIGTGTQAYKFQETYPKDLWRAKMSKQGTDFSTMSIPYSDPLVMLQNAWVLYNEPYDDPGDPDFSNDNVLRQFIEQIIATGKIPKIDLTIKPGWTEKVPRD